MAEVFPEHLDADGVLDMMLSRRRGRCSLEEMFRLVHPTYHFGRHHAALCEYLEAVERGEIQRLIVSMPPQHGKSTIATQLFPAWFLGRHPERTVISSGYSQDIANYHSRQTLRIIQDGEFKSLFPGVTLPGGRSPSVEDWMTLSGGGYKAAGVGGGITGRGADLGLIDDPVKNRAEAESLTIRDGHWDWYTSSFYTRLHEGAPIVLTMTRWHEDDLAGRLLDEMEEGGDQWIELKFPAIDVEGRALWPEHYSLETLRMKETAVGKYEWSALYQQEPTARGGNMFAVDEIKIHDTDEGWPAGPWWRFWDLASTKAERGKTDPDSTVGAKVAVTIDGEGALHCWIRDMRSCQEEAPARDKMIRATAKQDGSGVRVSVEGVGGYKDAATTLKSALKGHSRVDLVPVSSDKVVRAGRLEPVVEAGHLHLMRGDWNDRAISELTAFPNGAHDDFVDAIVGGFLAATGPDEHRKVFPMEVVARLYSEQSSALAEGEEGGAEAGVAPIPPGAPRSIGIAWSRANGHRVVEVARVEDKLFVSRETEVSGSAEDLAKAAKALMRGKGRGNLEMITLSVLDAYNEREVQNELWAAGIHTRPGAEEGAGVESLDSLLRDGRLVIAPECLRSREALLRFQTAAENPVTESLTGARGRFVWGGDSGFVRCLADLASHYRWDMRQKKGNVEQVKGIGFARPTRRRGARVVDEEDAMLAIASGEVLEEVAI